MISNLPRLRPTVFWPLLWASVCIFVQLRPIDDVDLFTQIRLGNLLLETGAFLRTEPFSYLHLGQMIQNPGWLAQFCFACAYSWGGWLLLKIVYGMLFASACLFSVLRAEGRIRRTGGAPRYFCLGAGLAIALLTAASNTSVRPQGIALLCFTVLLYLLEFCSFRSKTILGIGVLGLVWQNAHSSLSLAIGAVGVYFIPDCIAVIRKQQSGSRLLFLLSAVFVLGVCQLLTPLGTAIFQLGAANVAVSKNLLHVTEWLPPWDIRVRDAMYGFWFSIGVSLLSLLVLRGRSGLRECCECICYSLIALFAARFALFYAIALIPVWSIWFERSLSAKWFAWKPQRPFQFDTLTAIAFAFVAVLACSIPLAASFPKVDPSIPLDGIAFLREHLPEGRVFNYREWGGPLELLGNPQWQVHIDGRLYLYTKEDWRSYALAADGKIPIEDLERDFKPDAFFLHDSFHRNLKALLFIRPEWKEVYHNPPCSIFLRTNR